MDRNHGALAQIIIFVFGVWFDLPLEVSLSILIVRALEKAVCPGNIICDNASMYIFLLQIIGALMIVETVIFIYMKIRAGNW